jgi:hypothetical protein
MMSGVPVGDEMYVRGQLAAKVDKALSKLTTICSKLRDVHTVIVHTASLRHGPANRFLGAALLPGGRC